MSTFNELYGRNIHYLVRASQKIPSMGILFKPIDVFSIRYNEALIALMMTVERNPTPRQIERGSVARLQDILNDMPTSLRKGTISWLVLEGEEEPSALIIHKGITAEDLTRLAQTRLSSLSFETALKQPSFLRFFAVMKHFTHMKEAYNQEREQAKTSTLAHSEPVAHYMSGEQADRRRRQSPPERFTVKEQASMLIKQPVETVFEAVSHLETCAPGEPRAAEESAQVNEVRLTSEGPLGVGTTFVQITTVRAIPSETRIEITEYEPLHAITFDYVQLSMQISYTFAPTADGTRVTETVARGGCFSLLASLIWGPEKKHRERSRLERVKEMLER